MDNVNLTFKFLNELREFQVSKEFSFYQYLKANRTVMSVLQGNYRNLMKAFNHHNNPVFDDIHWQETSKQRWQLQRELIRLLSNYLSSIGWVVDYSRNTTEDFLKVDEMILKSFQIELKKKFSENSIHRFIQTLRNFISHKAFLKITTIKRITSQSPDIERNIFITKEQLVNSSFNWTGLAKEFLDKQDNEIYIIDLLSLHYKSFLAFQNYIYLKIIATNKSLFDNLIIRCEDIYAQAKFLNNAYILPFDSVYIRYLKYLSNYSAQHGV